VGIGWEQYLHRQSPNSAQERILTTDEAYLAALGPLSNTVSHTLHHGTSFSPNAEVRAQIIISNKDDLLGAWANHFSKLSKSRILSDEGLKQLGNKINDQATASLSNSECILDVPFTLGEVECAIKKLKSEKWCGPEGLSAEHLKWGGDSLHLWVALGHCQLNH